MHAAANILLGADGILKLADFGLSRFFFPNTDGRYTKLVVSVSGPCQRLSSSVTLCHDQRWYRAPELLFSNSRYDYSIDDWSVVSFSLQAGLSPVSGHAFSC